MKAEIKSFCLEYDYPQEAIDSLLNDFITLKKTEYYPMFRAYVDLYNNDDSSYDHSQSLKAMDLISQRIGIHEYSLKFLLHVCMARHCRELYDQAEIPVGIYHGAMLDLKWKLLECKRIMGIWGTFEGPWFDRFFNLSRFALGRLQFEDDISMEAYEKNGHKLHYGDWVINVHIPACGPLNTEECLKSFRMAEEFFSDRFPDGIVKFRCISQALSNSAGENTRNFADLFDVVDVSQKSQGIEVWNIFNQDFQKSGILTEMPLQNAYLNLLADGKIPQLGLGYLFMKNGKIIN